MTVVMIKLKLGMAHSLKVVCDFKDLDQRITGRDCISKHYFSTKKLNATEKCLHVSKESDILHNRSLLRKKKKNIPNIVAFITVYCSS